MTTARTTSGITLVLAVLFASPLAAQPAPPAVRIRFVGPAAARRPQEPTAIGSAVTLDRRAQQRLTRAREFLDQGKFIDALPVVQQALAESSDAFIPDAKDPQRLLSMKGVLEGWVRELSDEGRRSYELQFGPAARQMAKEVANDPLDVFRRFPTLEPGADAAWRHAVRLMDEGRFSEADRLFERFRATANFRSRFEPELSVRLAALKHRAGESNRAQSLLEEVAASHPQGKVRFADRVFDNSNESRTWLQRTWGRSKPSLSLFAEPGWTSPGAGPERRSLVASSRMMAPVEWPAGGVPLVVDPLKYPTDASESAFDRLLRNTVETLAALKDKDRRLWWPRFQPVVIGDQAIIRTLGNVRSIELSNGNRRWETLADDQLERLLVRDGAEPETSPSFRHYVDQRMWDDATTSRLSSDGALVFAIEDSGPAHPVDNAQARQQVRPVEHNRLAAYDGSTGKLVWEIGGPSGENALAEADTFFLGPPLAAHGRLYIFSEKSAVVRLQELDAADGRTLWTQPLVDVDASWSIARNPSRRLAGISPSLSQGYLICQTGVGLVVAVDVVERRLAWIQELPQPSTDAGFQAMPQPVETSKDTGWVDGSPIIVGDNVIVPRAGGHPLYSLSLRDGSRRWSLYSRGLPSNARWLAIDAAGRMLVVGERSVRAYRIDGKEPVPVWAKETSIPTSCGTGFVMDGVLFLPARETRVAETTGLILALETATGALLKSAPVLKGRAPGNLVPCHGLILSQSVERLDVFAMPEWKDAPAIAE